MKRAAFFLAISMSLAAGIWFLRPAPLLALPSSEVETIFPTGANRILENAESLTLCSLGDAKWKFANANEKPQFLRDYAILGSTQLRGEEKQQLLAHFYNSIARKTNFPTACFEPHHALRATHNGQSVDLVICFRCHHFKTFGLGAESSSPSGNLGREHFNAVLKNAGIELHPRA